MKDKKIRKIIFIFVIFLIFSIFLIMFPKSLSKNPPDSQLKSLTIGGETISVEVADSRQEVTQGLSHRDALPANQGMYFVLDQRRVARFWMKDMKFPIDIIWIDKGKVVGTEENAPIPTSLDIPTFTSPSEVTHVLEVNAGFAKEKKLKIGDRVIIEL